MKFQFYQVRETHPEISQHLWPQDVPQFQSVAMETFHMFKSIGAQLVGLVAQQLAIDPSSPYWQEILEHKLMPKETHSQAGKNFLT